jgi:hypothetical protein
MSIFLAKFGGKNNGELPIDTSFGPIVTICKKACLPLHGNLNPRESLIIDYS